MAVGTAVLVSCSKREREQDDDPRRDDYEQVLCKQALMKRWKQGRRQGGKRKTHGKKMVAA